MVQLVQDFKDFKLYSERRSILTVDRYTEDTILFLKFCVHSRDKTIDVKNTDISAVDIEYVKTITNIELDKFFQYLIRDRENGEATQNRRISSLKEFYKFLERYEVKNITKDLKKISGVKGKEIEYLTIEEEDKLLNSINKRSLNYKRDRALIVLMMKCGLRVSETTTLRYDIIKKELETDDYITVFGKGKKYRKVPVGAKTKEILLDYVIDRRYDSQELFNIKKRAIQGMVEKYSIKINKPDITCHTLRHTFGTRLAEKKASPFLIQKWLGHSDIKTSQIYVHLQDNRENDLNYVS